MSSNPNTIHATFALPHIPQQHNLNNTLALHVETINEQFASGLQQWQQPSSLLLSPLPPYFSFICPASCPFSFSLVYSLSCAVLFWRWTNLMIARCLGWLQKEELGEGVLEEKSNGGSSGNGGCWKKKHGGRRTSGNGHAGVGEDRERGLKERAKGKRHSAEGKHMEKAKNKKKKKKKKKRKRKGFLNTHTHT